VAVDEWPGGEAEPDHYWFSTLPADISLESMVDQAKLRWRIERDYLELKQEVGLGHYEGRGWRGFHHHATLCVAAYGFLISEKETIPPLRTCQRPAMLAIYPSRRLPTQRICRYDHNATCRTQSPRCVSVSREHCCWPCRGAPVAAGHRQARSSRTSDAVGLMPPRAMPELPRLSAPHEVLALSSGPHTHLICSPTQIGLMPHHSELQRLRR
jgi:hypothetical protein